MVNVWWCLVSSNLNFSSLAHSHSQCQLYLPVLGLRRHRPRLSTPLWGPLTRPFHLYSAFSPARVTEVLAPRRLGFRIELKVRPKAVLTQGLLPDPTSQRPHTPGPGATAHRAHVRRSERAVSSVSWLSSCFRLAGTLFLVENSHYRTFLRKG